MTLPESLIAIGFLSMFLHGAVDAVVVEPIRKRSPEANLWWVVYVALGLGVAVCALGSINAIPIPSLDGPVGYIMTGVAVGTGGRLIEGLKNFASKP